MALLPGGEEGSLGAGLPPENARRVPTSLLVALGLSLSISELLWGRLLGFQDALYPVDQFVGTLLLLSILYLLATFLLLRFSDRPHSRKLAVNVVIFLAATIFRLTAFPVSPSLSDDVYRYRWEGKLQVAGGNPYQVAPDDPAWRGLRDETYERIPVKEYPGGYGPIAMVLERMAFALSQRVSDDPFEQARLLKFPAAIADIGIVLLLAGWLRTRGRPPMLAGIYALCPLPILEFWGMGHNDALAIACLVGGFWAMDAHRERLGFLGMGAAVAVKWWPALLLPGFVGLSGKTPRRLLWAIVGLGIVPLAFLPFWSDVVQNARFMGGFAGGWRNNDSLFGITYALAGGDFDTAKWWTLAMIGSLATLAGVFIRQREVAGLVVLCGTLLLSANCHPWYLTWIVPLLVFVPWAPLLLWVSLVPLFYEVLIDYQILGVWEGSRPGRWLVYVPVFAMMAGCTARAIQTRWVRARTAGDSR